MVIVVIIAITKQSKRELLVENSASSNLCSPIRLPTRVAVARPNANGSMKNTLVILIAIVWLAITPTPRALIIKAAPLNILSSIKIPKPIGIPSLKTSLKVSNLGKVIDLKILTSL